MLVLSLLAFSITTLIRGLNALKIFTGALIGLVVAILLQSNGLSYGICHAFNSVSGCQRWVNIYVICIIAFELIVNAIKLPREGGWSIWN